MQTNSRDASTTSFWSRKLLSIFCLPGHQMPDMLWQWGHADISMIGRLVRFASANPDRMVPYQTIPPCALGMVPAGGPNGLWPKDGTASNSMKRLREVRFIS